MKISEVINYLEEWAPPSLQESYDNSGLITGDRSLNCTGAIVCLDSIEEVVQEAIVKNCNLIIAHHPIVFSGLKSLTGKNYIERTIIKAIKNDIAIYAIHTNLDNVYTGVNAKFSEKLGLVNTRILSPKKDLLSKLVVFCPDSAAEKVKNALFDNGAGHIGNYDHCSFSVEGEGGFRAGEGANPFVGIQGQDHSEKELRIEVVVKDWNLSKVIRAMLNAHPYEEVAYDVFRVNSKLETVGSGMIGELKEAMLLEDFLKSVKESLNLSVLKYTSSVKEKVKKIAICGGSGSFLLGSAMSKNADVFITGDYKYHQFFDADKKIVIVDVGHYESEIATIELILEKLKEKFTNFAVHLTGINTNPVNYL